MIIYIHGFRSSGNGNKSTLLKQAFGEENVFAPTLTHSPINDYLSLKKIVVNNQRILIVGSSLGGFYANILANQFNLKAVLINPSRMPHLSLTTYGEFESFSGDGKFKWTVKQTDELRQLYYEKQSMQENKDNLFFYISADDEVINNSDIIHKYKHVKIYHNSGHIFTRFSEILPDIKSIYFD